MMRKERCGTSLPEKTAGEDVEADQECLMRTTDQAAMAIARARADPDKAESASSKTPSTDHRRLRVPQKSQENTQRGRAAGRNTRHCDASVESGTTPDPLPATQKRAVDEVDVAAADIPLEVRRMQCTKSTLALKEATKNDATLQSSKLLDYFVSRTFGDDHMCPEKEMCQWLVAQMCDRMATGQVWVVAKTSSLLFTLLWRGSNSFVEAVHEYGTGMFQMSRIMELVKSTPQENLPGERLPCSLQPIVSACAAQSVASGKPKTHTACMLEILKQRACGKHACGSNGGASGVSDIPDDELMFMFANTAYMESLCEYRMHHPTLDLAHGEILMTRTDDPISVAETEQHAHSPLAWKELLDDTLELMKAIAVTNPRAAICPIGVSVATMRMRNAVLLYQVACRALVRVLHAVVTTLHTFVRTLQAGLQVLFNDTTHSASSKQSSQMSSGEDYFGKDAFNPLERDYSLSPDVMQRLTTGYYNAIYQFNRTVNMLRQYCEAAQHIDPDTSKRALAFFKLLPQEAITNFKESQVLFANPISSERITKLHHAVRQWAGLSDDATLTDNSDSRMTTSDASSPATTHSPLRDAEVRKDMMEVYKFHTARHEYKERLWKEQIEAVCSLFGDKESQMLHQIFNTGLAGLWQQWDEFTNNGAAAVEKALMPSVDSNSLSDKLDRSAQGVSSSEDGISDSLTKSSTYILRPLPSGVRVRAASSTKTDIITLDRSATEKSTESSIDALLLEDDVVVICNEECSCNDTLKLVDRFQVLLDVPLGEGSYGKVYRAWDEVVGCYLAAKELPLDASKAHNVAVREVLQEYTVLTELSHPNIVRVVAFMVLKQTARIYMEWMPSGSLQDVLRHHPRGMLRESVVRRYARDVLSGLAFLHSRGVIHRDVKPGNMLLSSDGAVKLTDFGTSLVLSGNTKTLDSNAVTGTAAYMAPECVQGTYSSASDIWSFGCSIVQLISGNVPWSSPTTASMVEPIALLFKIGSLDDATHLDRPHDLLRAAASAASREGGGTVPSLSTVYSGDTARESDSPAGDADDAVSAELLSMLDAIFVVDRRKRPSASELLQFRCFKMVD